MSRPEYLLEKAGIVSGHDFSRAANTAKSMRALAPEGETHSPELVFQQTLEQATAKTASILIDQRISDLADWRGKTLARVRALILKADPEITEEWKWRGTPVWSHGGIVCTGETYKTGVKLTFAKGAALSDPSGLFNSSLEGNVRRAIDIHEGDKINETALKVLILDAVALNLKGKTEPTHR